MGEEKSPGEREKSWVEDTPVDSPRCCSVVVALRNILELSIVHSSMKDNSSFWDSVLVCSAVITQYYLDWVFKQ